VQFIFLMYRKVDCFGTPTNEHLRSLNLIEIVSKSIFFDYSLFLKIFEMILKDEGVIQATGECTGKRSL